MDFIPYELDLRIVQLASSDRVRVPAYPAVAMQLKQLVLGDDFSLAELASVVKRDPSLTATVLRYASSAAIRGPREVRSLESAIGRIGAEGLVRLAFTAGLGAGFKQPSSLGVLRRRIWRQALTCAEICRTLAPGRGLDPDVAFLAGLLHDFGKAIALGCVEEILPRSARVREAHCAKVIDLYHVELGLVLAHRWKLPHELRDAIGRHHRADRDPLVELVALSDEILAAFEDGVDSVARIAALPSLQDDERWRLTVLAHDLPELLEAYSASDLHAQRAPRSALEQDASTIGEGDGATFPVCAGPHRWRATQITGTGVAVHSQTPIDSESVLKVSMQPPGGSLRLWMVVSRCAPEGRGYRIELKPTPLDERERERWKRLVASRVAA